MSGALHRVILILLAVTVLYPLPAFAAGAFDLHVLAIGSEHYAEPADETYSRFADLPGIGEGARAVAETFRAGGAKRVGLLTSGAGRLVSRVDVLDAVDQAIVEARKSGAPFLIVYFAGHGISEGFAWGHFSVPGTLVYQGELAALARGGQLERHALYAGEFVDRLAKGGIPYMLILDNCREGSRRSIEGVGQTLGKQGEDLFGTVQSALSRLNMFEGPNPVLFSTTPGTMVPTAANPDNQFDSIGPLGRRILLAVRKAKKGAKISLGSFVAALTNPRLDAETGPAVTHAHVDQTWRTALLRAGSAGPPVVQIQATASHPDPCCAAAPNPQLTGLTGLIRISARPPMHWLIAGEPRVLATPGATLTGLVPQAGAVTIEAEQGDTNWSLTLAAAEGETLSIGSRHAAERALLQGPNNPGLSFSTTAKSCNAVAARYDITDLAIVGDTVARLAATAALRCDDIPGEIQLEVEVRAAGQ